MNIIKLRKHFPLLSRQINGRPLAYLDNASTTQKPFEVISAMSDFYAQSNANIHRGIHTLSQEATAAYESVRDQTREFLHAKHREEIIFTSGATESLNLIAFGLAGQLKRGEEILLSEAEHHSNIVPWQIVARQKGLKIKYIPIIGGSTSLSLRDISPRQGRREKDSGRLDLAAFKKLLTKRTRIVSLTHASNVTGAITPLAQIIPAAHRVGALVIVDAAQSAAHLPIDVQKLNCDFLAFSAHKIYGPTGVGVLYGKKTLLSKLAPRRLGGHMIEKVTKTKTTFAQIPERLEGGTMPIAEVVGLGAAIKFIQKVGYPKISKIGSELTVYALKKLQKIPGLKLLGPAQSRNRLPIFSFTLENVPAHDLGTLLDQAGIAVRSGHHCAQVLHTSFGLLATTRASLSVYNTQKEIDRLIERILEIKKIFHG